MINQLIVAAALVTVIECGKLIRAVTLTTLQDKAQAYSYIQPSNEMLGYEHCSYQHSDVSFKETFLNPHRRQLQSMITGSYLFICEVKANPTHRLAALGLNFVNRCVSWVSGVWEQASLTLLTHPWGDDRSRKIEKREWRREGTGWRRRQWLTHMSLSQQRGAVTR